jgi:MFS transporter, FSR family, fosmidomycin resistance protein
MSILGVLPFALILPYASLFWTASLSVLIAVMLSSAFPAIIVFAQELIPGRVGMVAGIFFGLAFGLGGIGAVALGVLADAQGIDFVYRLLLPAAARAADGLPARSAQRAGRGTADAGVATPGQARE